MGDGLMTGGFDGWRGAAPGGSNGGGTGVQSIVPGTGISVDNTDPQNPIVSNTATLASLYQFGLGDNPAVDNVLVGSYFDLNFETDGSLQISTKTPSPAPDPATHPGLIVERANNQAFPQPVAYLVAEWRDRNAAFAGGAYGGMRQQYVVVDSAGSRTLIAVNDHVEEQANLAYYNPLPGAAHTVTHETTFLLNRFGGQSIRDLTSDGVEFRQLIMPDQVTPTMIYGQTWAMQGSNAGGSIASGSSLRSALTGPQSGGSGLGPPGLFITGYDFYVDSTNGANPTQAVGHGELWARGPTLGDPVTTALQWYADHVRVVAALEFGDGTAASVSQASTARVAYNTTDQRLELSNNTGAYSPILTEADIGPTTGSIVTDVVSATQNLKTATTFTVVPSAVGRTFLPIAAYIEFTTVTALATGPTLKLGNNGAHDNTAPALAVANTVVTGSAPPFVMASDVSIIDLNATGIICELTVNAGGTTCQGRVHVIGVYTT